MLALLIDAESQKIVEITDLSQVPEYLRIRVAEDLETLRLLLTVNGIDLPPHCLVYNGRKDETSESCEGFSIGGQSFAGSALVFLALARIGDPVAPPLIDPENLAQFVQFQIINALAESE